MHAAEVRLLGVADERTAGGDLAQAREVMGRPLDRPASSPEVAEALGGHAADGSPAAGPTAPSAGGASLVRPQPISAWRS
jgi:hypothetical protein